MNLEIHKPELVQRVNAHIQSATSTTRTSCSKRPLMLSTNRQPPPRRRQPRARSFWRRYRRPYPDIDLTPPRVRLTNVRDVVL
jgi:hypothetical protein